MVSNYKVAIKVALGYFIFSFLYITMSDSLLLMFIDDPYTLTVFQTYKGIAFVSITAVLLFLVISRELKKEKTYKRELQKAKERAENSDRLKTDFLNNMSHEIRTPLNSILGFSEILATDELDEYERKEYIKVLNNSGVQLLRIIDDILDISRIESGIITIKEDFFSLKDLVEELSVFTNELVRQKGKVLDISFINNVEEEMDDIESDRGRVVQILSNLITNAIKFTPNGFVEVKCCIDSNDYLSFHVKDSGIGIAEDKIKQVFDPFVQEEHSTIRTYGGTGLGLSISKALVDILGGSIDVRSQKGKGSEFSVVIPRVMDKSVIF